MLLYLILWRCQDLFQFNLLFFENPLEKKGPIQYNMSHHPTCFCRRVGMADEADSKSVGGDVVWVQVPPPAPARRKRYNACGGLFPLRKILPTGTCTAKRQGSRLQRPSPRASFFIVCTLFMARAGPLPALAFLDCPFAALEKGR